MTIDIDTLWTCLKMTGVCMGAIVGMLALAALNDMWLRYALTPEEYERMVESYDDWPY